MSDLPQDGFLARWKAALQPRELQLSVGPVLLRPVQLDGLVARGVLPLPLLQQLESVNPKPGGGFRYEDLIAMAPAINAVTMAAVVDPPVTEYGDEHSIAVDDIPLADRMIIFEEASKPVTAYATFPEGEEQPGARDVAVSDGDAVRETTE